MKSPHTKFNHTSNAHKKREHDPNLEIRSSNTPSESEISIISDDSVDEELVSAGATRLSESGNSRQPLQDITEAISGIDEPPSSKEDENSDRQGENELKLVRPQRHVGFPPVEEIPEWFPENVKRMYRVDRHGGALKYSVSHDSTPICNFLSLQGTQRNHPLPCCTGTYSSPEMEEIQRSWPSAMEVAAGSSPSTGSPYDQEVLQVSGEAIQPVEG